MARVTEAELRGVFKIYARHLGREVGWKKGQVYLSGAYGGWAVAFVMTDGGGITQVPSYHLKKALLIDMMRFAMESDRANQTTPSS